MSEEMEQKLKDSYIRVCKHFVEDLTPKERVKFIEEVFDKYCIRCGESIEGFGCSCSER